MKFVLVFTSVQFGWSQAFANAGSVWLKQDSFVSPSYSSTTQKSYQYIGAEFSNVTMAPQSGLLSELSGEFAFSQPLLSFLNIEQLYWQQDGLSAGRKKYLWSDLEQIWDLGLFQPQFTGRPLEPVSQGLTGLFLDFDSENKTWAWGSVMFASPLFVPDQGAAYKVEDGKFQENNPWFPNPPKEVIVLGQRDSIKYNVQVPDINKIIFNPSFGAMAFVHAKPYGFFARSSVASKPSNQLLLGIDGVARETSEVEIDIRPQFFNHRLFSVDVGYDSKLLGTAVSVLQERAEQAEFDPKWNYPVYGVTNYSTVSAWIKPLKKTKGTISYLKVGSQEVKAVGARSQDFESFFSDRTHLTDAYKLRVESEHRTGSKQTLKLGSQWTESVSKEFTLFAFDLDWQFERFWSVKANSRFIKVSEEVTKGNYYSFQDNDSVGFGVAYVF